MPIQVSVLLRVLQVQGIDRGRVWKVDAAYG